VSGSMILTVSDMEGTISSDTVKDAVVETIANVAEVPSDYVDVDVATEDAKRRLRASQLSENSNLRVTYVISVPGDAPENVQATGVEVGDRLKAASSTSIESLISTNVAESEGSGSVTFSIQAVGEPEVVVKSSPGSNGSTSPPPMPSGPPETMSGANTRALAGRIVAICLVVSLSSLQCSL